MNHTKTTIHSYEKNARRFAEIFMNYPPYQQQVAAFAGHLSANSQVLDLGCGPGNVARQLLSLLPLSITGVDLSKEMTELAKTHAPSATFQVHDIRTVDFAPASFDAVILSFSIVHLTDEEAEELFANVSRWLKPDGLLYLSFIEGKTPGFETTSFSPDPLFFNYYDRSQLEQRLASLGLSVFHRHEYAFPETDGSFSTEVFFFARRGLPVQD